MNTQRTLSLTALLTILIFSSCQVMYRPTMQNVPLLKEKGEVRATFNHANYEVAYSPVEHVGIMANGHFSRNEYDVTFGDTYTYLSKRYSAELGAGYYMPIDQNFLFEVYGGGGIGGVYHSRESSSDFDELDSDLYRVFLQPNLGVTGNIADFAVSGRFVSMKFYNTEFNDQFTSTEREQDEVANLETPMWTFFEPGITIRVGYKYVKFHSQFFLSAKLNEQPLNYQPWGLNFGIHIDIAKRLFDSGGGSGE